MGMFNTSEDQKRHDIGKANRKMADMNLSLLEIIVNCMEQAFKLNGQIGQNG